MEARVARLDEDGSEVKATLRRLEPMIVSIDAVVPHLATKAELEAFRGEVKAALAEKPSRAYLWGILGAPIAAYACGLAALAVLK